MEIQGTIGSVLELTVKGLAGDFLGVRVGLFFICVIHTAIAPPRELAGTLLAALLDNSADGVWEALMADPVHNDIGDGFQGGITLAPGLPVDAAGKTGEGIVQVLFANRIDRLRLGLRDDLGRSRRHLTALGRGLLLQHLRLALGGFRFLGLVSSGRLARQRNIARKTAANICCIIEPPIAACRVVGETKTAVGKDLIYV